MNILAATDHFRLKHDTHYTLGDFASRLRQRPDLTDELALAFDDLLDIINQVPDPREGTESLLESGFFSCLPSRVNTGIENVDDEVNGWCQDFSPCCPSRVNTDVERLGQEANSDHDSDESFKDALDGLQLATDDTCATSATTAL
jgi:hypothetical protein